MNMIATVLRVNPGSLLVRDDSNGQEVLVNYRNANQFRVGDYISILYEGVMTASIPPQITATVIDRVSVPNPGPGPGPTPPPPVNNEFRGTVLQTGRDSLVVRGENWQQFRVSYRYAYHFCRGQRVRIQYNNMNSQSWIMATDITPIC